MSESIHLLPKLLKLRFPKRNIGERAGGQEFIFHIDIRKDFKEGHV